MTTLTWTYGEELEAYAFKYFREWEVVHPVEMGEDPLESRLFYELMQCYRHAGIDPRSDDGVVMAFECVKEFVTLAL